MKIVLTREQRKAIGWALSALILAALSIGLGVSFPVADLPDLVEVDDPMGELEIQSFLSTAVADQYCSLRRREKSFNRFNHFFLV